MSDKKKGFQPPTSGTSGSSPSPTGGSSAGAPSGSRSAARRSSQPVRVSPEPQSPLEKYRFPLIIGVVVVGLIALGAIFMQSATAAPYSCTTLMTPGPVEAAPTQRPERSAVPAQTPEPQPTQRLGFVAGDMGQAHVGESTSITYAYCPPTSGQHYSSNEAPLPRRFYGPTDSVRPGNWIHNLEHGFVVLLYRGEPDAATLAELRAIMDGVPGTTFSTETCKLPNKVIVARFDDMTTPYAAVAWDRALLLDAFDAQQLSTFAQQWQESPVWPEQGSC